MSRTPVDYLHGTLETLVLKTLTRGPMHGYAVARWIEDATDDALAVEEGSLYPALTAWRRRAGSKPSGAPPTSAAAPNSIGSPASAASSWRATPRPGPRSPPPSTASS